SVTGVQTCALPISLNFCLYKPCTMCLSLLHFQPCAGSVPDCNCCLSNKYTYMQLRSPEVTRVNFHLSDYNIDQKMAVRWRQHTLKILSIQDVQSSWKSSRMSIRKGVGLMQLPL